MAGKTKEKKPRKPRKKFTRRWWTDEERFAIMAALASNGGDVSKTARETGCPYYTLYAWKNGIRYAESLQLYTEKKGELASACDDLAWLFAAIIPEKIDAAPLSSMTTGFGILVDKARILRGEPTVINQNQGEAALNTRLVELLKNLSHEQRSQLEAFLTRLATAGSDDGERPQSLAIDQGSGPTGELPSLPESGVPDRGSLGNIQG